MSETFRRIQQRCLASRTLYEDASFPADARVLFRQGPYYGVRWKRPQELSKKPVFIQDGAVYYDMNQGSVGAFHFNFWSYGKWVEIVVDDRLPTFNNKLIYASNEKHPEEFWCPLLEKAFAKLHGSYDVLDGGRVHTSLVDLTGGIGEMLALRDNITDKVLQDILLNCRRMNSIMGAAIFNLGSVPGEREVKQDTGLYEGHAYSIVDVRKATSRQGSTTLLHVRNPWGCGEWNGAWSDKSSEWNSLSEEDKKSTFRSRDDGEFWISLSDFRKHFNELELCHLTPDALTQELASNMHLTNWHISEHYGSWVLGLSAGGPPVSFTSKRFWSNPQFELQVRKAAGPVTIIISLFEVDSLLRRGTEDISIGFVIFKLQEGHKPGRITAENFYEYSPRMIETSGPYWPYRERTVRYTMQPGNHVIVPCTFKAGQAAEFYIRIFSEEVVESKPMNEPTGGDLVPMSPKDLSDAAVDRRFDDLAGKAGVIDAVDLVEVFKAGLAAAEGKNASLNLETCRCLVGLSAIQSPSGILDKEGVRKVWSDLEMWRKAFRYVDKDNNKCLDGKELKTLFEIIDFHAGQEAVEAILKRYGGKSGHISEEDFLQGFCKALQQYRTFRELQSHRKLSMTLGEWMLVALRI